MENNWAYNTSPGNITYAATFKQNGQVVHEQPVFTHYHHARWRKTLWTGSGEPKVQVRHHLPYFMASRITWNFDLNLRASETALANLDMRLASSNTGPMGPAMIATYFPGTGGRDDIGPVPRWTALYLISQDERARRAMFANADAAAGIPMHYRDAATGQPIDLDRHPGVALRFGTSSSTDALPAMTNATTP